MINLLLDRLVFNTLSFYHIFPTFGAFVLQTLKQEETLGLADSFEDVISNTALLESKNQQLNLISITSQNKSLVDLLLDVLLRCLSNP